MIAPPRPADPRRRLPVVAMAGAALLAGLAGAVVLLGYPLPDATLRLVASHGALMVLGFLGTLVSLERAVALGRPWGWVAPLASGAAGVSLILGLPFGLSAALFVLGGLALVAIYLAFDRVERSLHGWVQATGALAWLVGALLLLGGWPVREVVPWLGAFLVLTITGERLELSRIGRQVGRERPLFLAALAAYGAGVVVTVPLPEPGYRVMGLGLLALALWSWRYDLARHTVRRTGITRFIAVCLLAGYAWLGFTGAWWLVGGAVSSGTGYDATLHALFLGFVISMVFGHAPIILPAVLGLPLPYHPAFYLHVTLLHAGLVLRVFAGDVLGVTEAWRVGGLLNALAVLLFVVASVIATAAAMWNRGSRRAPSRP